MQTKQRQGKPWGSATYDKYQYRAQRPSCPNDYANHDRPCNNEQEDCDGLKVFRKEQPRQNDERSRCEDVR